MSKIPLYTKQGEQKELLQSIAIEKKEMNPAVYAAAIRVLRQNWRQGTVGCKTRAEVTLSNKKPWRQKGTGRARVGTARSPLWRGGGIIFGPQARTRTLSLTQSQRALAMNNLYFTMLEDSRIACLDFVMEQEVPRTKVVMDVLKKMGLNNKKVLLFLHPDDELMYTSFRNIPSVHVLFFDNPNVYDLSYADHWVFLKKDEEAFNAMVTRWN